MPAIDPTTRDHGVPDESALRDLELMAEARRYRRWVTDVIRPYVGRHVLEVGAGIGNYSEFLADRPLVALEISPTLVRYLRRRFAGKANVTVVEQDILDPSVLALKARRFDTVVCLDVLEHLADDEKALRHIHELLADGGHFLLKVPAIPALYGTIDRAIGHARRYRFDVLRRLLKDAGFIEVRQHYMNLVGFFAWWMNARVWRRTVQSAAQIRAFDRWVVPVSRSLERRWSPPFGQSLVAVCRKAGAS